MRLIHRMRRLLTRAGRGRFEQGRLHLPSVLFKDFGSEHRAVLKLTATSPSLQLELESIDPPLPATPATFEAHAEPDTRQIDFICNVCGGHNEHVPLALVEEREGNSCLKCGASLRIRSLIQVLTTELFGKIIPLPDIPVAKHLHGIGMSDWNGYADTLAQKLSYTNTFYHQPPHLDITDVPASEHGKYDFITSSDVMEHVPNQVDESFRNMADMLKPGGVLVLTVPYKPDGEDEEFYPGLHDFRVITTKGKRFLYNRTVDGEEQIYDNLEFHGGDGYTVFMRLFSEAGLLKRLEAAGFDGGIEIYGDAPAHGIVWPITWCRALAARKKRV